MSDRYRANGSDPFVSVSNRSTCGSMKALRSSPPSRLASAMFVILKKSFSICASISLAVFFCSILAYFMGAKINAQGYRTMCMQFIFDDTVDGIKVLIYLTFFSCLMLQRKSHVADKQKTKQCLENMVEDSRCCSVLLAQNKERIYQEKQFDSFGAV